MKGEKALAKWLSDTGRSVEELGLALELSGSLAHAQAEMREMRAEYKETQDPAIKKEIEELKVLILGTEKCLNSGTYAGSREAARSEGCSRCGFRFDATPRHNRRVAGEILEGWTVRIPSHKDVK